MARNMVINARDPLLSKDDLRFGPVIESVSQDEGVRFAYLMNHQGEVLYHSDPERTGEVMIQGALPPENGIIQASAPIQVEDVLVGTAVVGLGMEHIDQAMLQTATGLLLPLGLGAGAGVLGIILLAGLHVNRIKRLEGAVQALGAGEELVQVEDNGIDEVGRLSKHFNDMVCQLKTAREQNERNLRETIRALATAVEAKDAYTRGHCERVARISLAIGKRVQPEKMDWSELELSGILHDVGKIGVRAGILGKIGPLTQEEYEGMQHHPDIGAMILSPISSLGTVGLYVRHHHENFDGSGYPAGLKEDEIPMASRIIRLVDSFDAMTTNRPYRHALPKEEAFERISEGRGRQFDPALVDVFFQLEAEGHIENIFEEVKLSDAV
ncbi:MAG: HD domain-containing protein [Desulfohalobiaceae bacterium]|nr:HD domain-containing protein [Desulfohalobiaceae bacterium]